MNKIIKLNVTILATMKKIFEDRSNFLQNIPKIKEQLAKVALLSRAILKPQMQNSELHHNSNTNKLLSSLILVTAIVFTVEYEGTSRLKLPQSILSLNFIIYHHQCRPFASNLLVQLLLCYLKFSCSVV